MQSSEISQKQMEEYIEAFETMYNLVKFTDKREYVPKFIFIGYVPHGENGYAMIKVAGTDGYVDKKILEAVAKNLRMDGALNQDPDRN